MEQLKDYLARNLEVPVAAISDCEAHLQRLKVTKNQFLLRAGEICRGTYFVEKGLLRMFAVDVHGKEHIIQFAPETWMISDRSSLYFAEKSAYFIEAVEDSEVLLLQQDFFTALIQHFPHAGEKNDLLLQKHIRSLQKRLNSLLADTAEQRYMDFIRMFPDLLLRVPQWMVASYLGITPESLSRVRKKLAENHFNPS